MKDLRNSTAIITGASRGIGVHIARVLATEGVNLALAARSTSELDQVAAEMSGLGVRAVAIQCDVADPVARRSLVDAATAEFGSIDLLINNAGIETTVRFEEQDPEDFEHMVQVNLIAVTALSRLVVPGMLERGRGHVVNIASLAGKAGTPYEAAYATTKHGMIGFTRSLRGEYHGTGVGFSAICPGFVSDVGMYADSMVEIGIKAPWTLGTSKPEKVAKAVLKAVKHNKAEIIVNPNATRVLLTIAEASPTLGEWLMRRMGAATVFKQAVDIHDRDTAATEIAGG
jgi:short-subunit dehydrogenase